MVFLAPSAFSQTKLPRLKVGTDWYTNVTVTRVTATDIYFSYPQGMGNAKLKSLDAATQKLFKFDPAKAGEAEKQQTEADAAYRLQLQNSANTPRPATKPEVHSEVREEPVTPADIVVQKISARSFRGKPAPDLVVEKWLTAQPVMPGKFVMIDFWATWCGPCRQSIPDINKLHAKFKDQLVIIGLSDQTESEVRGMKSPKMDYFVATDRASTMKNTVGVTGIPHALIIDPKGIVRFEGHPGYLNEQNVAGLLAKYSD